MKKGLIVVATLLATISSCLLSSCKKKSQDNTTPDNVTHFAYIIDSSVSYQSPGDKPDTGLTYITPTYTADSKLSSVKWVHKYYRKGVIKMDSAVSAFTYFTDKCVITHTDWITADTVYTDASGNITQVNSHLISYYSGTNKIQGAYGEQYVWDGDNLKSFYGTADSMTYGYWTTKDATLADPLLLFDYLRFGRILIHNKNLSSSYTQSGPAGDMNCTIDYTFDASGRVTTVHLQTVGLGNATYSGNGYIMYKY